MIFKKKIFTFLFFISNSILFSQNIIQLTSLQFFEIQKKFDYKNGVIIDARSPEKFNAEHINHAINIDAENIDVECRIKEHLDKKQIVVYCTTHNRATKIIDIINKLNYQGEIIDIVDGFVVWKSNNHPTNLDTEKKTSISSDTIFKPDGKIIIQIFGNFEYNATKDVTKDYSFWFGRAHFGYQYNFSKNILGHIVLDASRPTTINEIKVTDSSNNQQNVNINITKGAFYTVFLKFAFIEYHLKDLLKIQAGSIVQNHYMVQEKYWANRFIAETFLDRYYKIPSGDLGFIFYFKPIKFINIDFAITNGEGFRFDQDNKGFVKIASGIDLIPFENVHLRAYYHNNKLIINNTPLYQHLYSFFAGYMIPNKFRIAAEFNYLNKNTNNILSFGYSIYFAFKILKNIDFFARFDNSRIEDVSLNSSNIDYLGKAFISGFCYSPVKNVNLSLNYQGFYNSKSQNRFLLSFEYKL